jgi:hypothetical protein
MSAARLPGSAAVVRTDAITAKVMRTLRPSAHPLVAAVALLLACGGSAGA